jgi:uncharacterized membrane protein YuzA (DUF378 family)
MQTEGRVRVNAVDWLSLVLVVVGALNWGLIGIGYFLEANWNLVNLVFGSVPVLENVIYLLVGLAGLYELYFGYQLYGARRPRAQPREETRGN